MAITRIPKILTLMTSKASNGVGSSILVNDYKNIMIDIATASSANLIVKIQGSYNPPTTAPTFSSAASATNKWFYVATYDLNNPLGVVGSTGYTFSGTDAVKGLAVNVDGLVWLNVEVSSYVAGNVSVNAIVYTNQ